MELHKKEKEKECPGEQYEDTAGGKGGNSNAITNRNLWKHTWTMVGQTVLKKTPEDTAECWLFPGKWWEPTFLTRAFRKILYSDPVPVLTMKNRTQDNI